MITNHVAIEKMDEQGKKILEFDGLTFELVEKITRPYEIWNIGTYMADGYLPLCRLKRNQPFTEGRCIEMDTLRAIKTDGAQVILAAIGGGHNTVSKMEEYIEKYENARPGTYSHEQVQKMKKALPYMYKLWD